MPALVVALFFVAHGLIHASFVSPAPAAKPGAPQWPFDLTHSWLLGPIGLDGGVAHAIGIALLVATLAGYLTAAAAVIGLLPAALATPAIVIGSVASLAMLALFFHPWLVFGLVIDAVLLWAVLLNSWRPGGAGL